MKKKKYVQLWDLVLRQYDGRERSADVGDRCATIGSVGTRRIVRPANGRPRNTVASGKRALFNRLDIVVGTKKIQPRFTVYPIGPP